MRCRDCNSQDLEEISFNYYECKVCGKLNYIDKAHVKRSDAASELYLAIGAVAVILIIVILILLFVTAAGRRGALKSPEQNKPVYVENKKSVNEPAKPQHK